MVALVWAIVAKPCIYITVYDTSSDYLAVCIQRKYVGHDLILITNFLGFVFKTNPPAQCKCAHLSDQWNPKVHTWHARKWQTRRIRQPWLNEHAVHPEWIAEKLRQRSSATAHAFMSFAATTTIHTRLTWEPAPHGNTASLECSPRIFCALQIKTICYALECFCCHIEWLKLRQAHFERHYFVRGNKQASHKRESQSTVFFIFNILDGAVDDSTMNGDED